MARNPIFYKVNGWAFQIYDLSFPTFINNLSLVFYMNKSTVRSLIVIITALVVIGTVFAVVLMRNSGYAVFDTKSAGNRDAVSQTSGDVQQVTLSIKNYNYYPQTITVKQGVPVRLTLDSSVTGCYRTFVIPAFGVNSYSKDSTDVIIFTPTTKGIFKFQCSMGMGYGTLIVE